MDAQQVINQINQLRKEKNYIESDKLRSQLINRGYKLKFINGIVILDESNKLKKCSVCKKMVINLTKCSVLTDIWHGYGANPDYKIQKETIKYLCNNCKEMKYTLSNGYSYYPFIL